MFEMFVKSLKKVSVFTETYILDKLREDTFRYYANLLLGFQKAIFFIQNEFRLILYCKSKFVIKKISNSFRRFVIPTCNVIGPLKHLHSKLGVMRTATQSNLFHKYIFRENETSICVDNDEMLTNEAT